MSEFRELELKVVVVVVGVLVVFLGHCAKMRVAESLAYYGQHLSGCLPRLENLLARHVSDRHQ